MKLSKHGPNTVSSKKALRGSLEEINEAGFAIDDEELAADLYGMAAPIRNGARDVVGAST